jgi:hypothetical protein
MSSLGIFILDSGPTGKIQLTATQMQSFDTLGLTAEKAFKISTCGLQI